MARWILYGWMRPAENCRFISPWGRTGQINHGKYPATLLQPLRRQRVVNLLHITVVTDARHFSNVKEEVVCSDDQD